MEDLPGPRGTQRSRRPSPAPTGCVRGRTSASSSPPDRGTRRETPGVALGSALHTRPEDGMPHEWHREGFTISTDHARLDLDAVYEFLSTSYWARGIPRDVMERSIAHAIPFGIYEGSRQVGFARVVSDRATVGYLGDVYVLEPWRGRGL